LPSRDKVPNYLLRRYREDERRESRGQFADAIAAKAAEMGESVVPSERYVARLEDGDVRYPSPPYRRVLVALCGRSLDNLGFVRSRTRAIAVLDSANRGLSKPDNAGNSQGAGDGARQGAAYDDDAMALSEWPVWFGVRTARLITLVDRWHDPASRADSLQELLHQEIVMFDAVTADNMPAIDRLYEFSRRQALLSLAALPLSLFLGGPEIPGDPGTSAATELFLSRSAASITACWHLLKGADLPTVDHVLSAFIITLEGIARQQSKYQGAAARLASQAHRISGIIALHRNQLKLREAHCKQALHYATIASDASSQASAIISLASTYYYTSEPARAAAVYERALELDSGMPPLQRSRVRAELSVAYGQLRREQEAIRSAGVAEEMYPDNPEQDPSFLYAEFTPASLTLERGLAFVALAEQFPGRNYQDKAAEIFGRLDGMAGAVPERIRFEIINHQATTAVLRNDLEAFEAYTSQAIEGVTLLASEQRLRELKTAWYKAAEAWPREPRIKALGDGIRTADTTRREKAN
jgi:tetratricopeptide (TPR) repeat protein